MDKFASVTDKVANQSLSDRVTLAYLKDIKASLDIETGPEVNEEIDVEAEKEEK